MTRKHDVQQKNKNIFKKNNLYHLNPSLQIELNKNSVYVRALHPLIIISSSVCVLPYQKESKHQD